MDEGKIYQRIGEFVVGFQWIENKIREIGWIILDPSRKSWPPMDLRKETTIELFDKVQRLFLDALPRCRLGTELEGDFRKSFAENAERFRELRRARNKILHSAYIELKAGGELRGLMRANPKLDRDSETGELLFDREILSEKSFEEEFGQMAEVSWFLGMCYLQLVHRLPAE